jgi:hypothetical protein
MRSKMALMILATLSQNASAMLATPLKPPFMILAMLSKKVSATPVMPSKLLLMTLATHWKRPLTIVDTLLKVPASLWVSTRG